MSFAVMTGTVSKTFTLNDGTAYDTSTEFVTVASQEHADELAHLIGLFYAEKGHPALGDQPFLYEAPAEFVGYTPHPDNNLTEN